MSLTRRDLCIAPPITAPRALALGGLLLLATAAGCKKERPVPPGPSGLPPLPEGAQARQQQPAARPMHAPQDPAAGAMPAGHPPVLKGASEQQAPAAEAPDPNARLSGVIKLSDKLRAKLPKEGTPIFIMVRAAPAGGGRTGGPPLAATKLTAGQWPLRFEVTGADAMLPGVKLQGNVVVTARVDQDGDAMTKQKGDLEGASKPVSLPADKIELVLDTERTEDAGSPLPPGAMGGGRGGGGLPPGHP